MFIGYCTDLCKSQPSDLVSVILFCFQLLDLFPDEAGGKNKRARVIPFLPGKRFPFSSISSKEKAEKRFPEIVKYVRYVPCALHRCAVSSN